MKSFLSLTSIVTLFMFATCKKEAATPGKEYIPVNQCQSYYADSITCCLDSVLQDSRCPVNVIFVWQGIAVARFKVKAPGTAHTITLATWKFQSYIKDTTISGFKIELVNLNGQNNPTKPFGYNDCMAEVKVTRQ